MPRPRRRATRERKSDDQFNQGREFHLWVGDDFFGDGYGSGTEFDRELAKAHWFRYRSEIIERYQASDNYGPDQPMPWAFYEFESEDE